MIGASPGWRHSIWPPAGSISDLVDEIRDRSFRAYVDATVHARGSGLRLVTAACLSIGLIVSQGTLGLLIVLAAIVGAPLVAYPLWRRWGRPSRFSD